MMVCRAAFLTCLGTRRRIFEGEGREELGAAVAAAAEVADDELAADDERVASVLSAGVSAEADSFDRWRELDLW